MPWSPLAGGFLTGKYRRDDTSDTGRLSGPNPFGDSKFTDRNWTILQAAESVAQELGHTVAQIALAWTLARPGVASTLIGASKISQLKSNLTATDIVLSAEHMARLDEASAPTPGFSDMLTSRDIRKMVHGGHAVSGWDEQQ
ncbi:aldo/keto reductase [Croceicoccus hydrothermalis]|uniref:aldo/keto reductase n=1 Tax=Croceicoccus hydrothermalis TaxID=2867964 RepID=UPI001EFA974D|nr:aldo/keto reductase [Croceicoccus hydrothermalis]